MDEGRVMRLGRLKHSPPPNIRLIMLIFVCFRVKYPTVVERNPDTERRSRSIEQSSRRRRCVVGDRRSRRAFCAGAGRRLGHSLGSPIPCPIIPYSSTITIPPTPPPLHYRNSINHHYDSTTTSSRKKNETKTAGDR